MKEVKSRHQLYIYTKEPWPSSKSQDQTYCQRFKHTLLIKLNENVSLKIYNNGNNIQTTSIHAQVRARTTTLFYDARILL